MIGDATDAVRLVRHLRGAPSPRSPAKFEWAHRGAAMQGDLYTTQSSFRATVVMVPGVVPEGRRDSGLVRSAVALSRRGFAVMVPDIPSFHTRCLSAADAAPIADAVRALLARREGAGPVGVAAVSSAVGPAVLAVLEPDLARRVDFIIAIGGYIDSRTAVGFFTTGHYREAAATPWRTRTPYQYTKWMFVRANSERLDDRRDRAILGAIAGCKLQDLDADVTHLTPGLGPQGRAVMALLDNRDPERVPALIAALPPGVRSDLNALDLSRRDFGAVRARFHIIHYREDATFPYTESIALARALRPGQAELTLLNGRGHADLRPSGVINPFRLWRAAYHLMGERHAA